MNTIAAISTPNAVGGIAMIRVSGDNAIEAASAVFQPVGNIKVTEMRGYTCAYGYITDHGERLDDVVLTVFRAPHSYTGEDTVEITCHGGLYLSKQILALLYRCGSRRGCNDESETDLAGRCALSGETGKVMVFRRLNDMPYTVTIETADAKEIANREKALPREYINAAGNNITDQALSYFMPLIQGELVIQMNHGVPAHFTIQESLLK